MWFNVLAFFVLIAPLRVALADDYREGGSEHAGELHWGYRSQKNPTLKLPHEWGAIHKTCESGALQSPLDIRFDKREKTTIPALTVPDFTYGLTKMVVFHNRHTVQATDTSGRNFLTHGETKYFLKNIHYHIKSEHLLDGEQFDLEVHMVHASEEGKLLVLGVLIDVTSGTTQFGSELIKMISMVRGRKDEYVPVDIEINPSRFLPKDKAFATYSGSLTTPPCTEGVRWIVFLERMFLGSDEQAVFQQKKLKIGFQNFRPHFSEGNHKVEFSLPTGRMGTKSRE